MEREGGYQLFLHTASNQILGGGKVREHRLVVDPCEFIS